MNEQNPAQAQNHSLSFTKLTAMIIGSTIGGGIFTTAGDMAVRIPAVSSSAGPSAASACSA